MKNYSNYKINGFSLVELLVVVAIIAVLAGVGLVSYKEYTDSSRKKVLEQNWNVVVRAMENETLIVSNYLGSAIKEIDKDGDWIDESGDVTANEADARFINTETSCLTFLHSIKNHFITFKNPWQDSPKVSITVDTEGQANHKRGQIQLTCYKNSGGFGEGSGCPIPNARYYSIVYFEDAGRWFQADGMCGDECQKIKIFGSDYIISRDDAKLDCRWDEDTHGEWKQVNDINPDADY